MLELKIHLNVRTQNPFLF